MSITPTKERGETPATTRANRHGELEPGLAQLDMSKLKITLVDPLKPIPDVQKFSFGSLFSDHMAITTFHPDSGWSAPEIRPYAPLSIDPSASCFHYGCNVYEGMKAFMGPDGKARLFRPEMNMRRLERSMARLALPPIDGDAVLELIKRFVLVDKRWIDTLPGYNLYLRPIVIGTRPAIGITASDHAILCVMACPAGPYFPRPVSLLAEKTVVRAWPGGTGGEKVGGNYAPTFLPQRIAHEQGYDQVLWLFGKERHVTEAGAANVFVVIEREDGDLDALTPPLDGTILPGITRASCLTLLSDPTFHACVPAASDTGTTMVGRRIHATERAFTMSDLERWYAAGTLLEFLCVGTAVIVSAVHNVGYDGRVVVQLPTYPSDPNGLGPVGRTLRDKIIGIQEGRAEYEGWGVVCE